VDDMVDDDAVDEVAGTDGPGDEGVEAPAAAPDDREDEREAGAEAPPLVVSDVELPPAVFGQTPHVAVMHQAHVRQLANARQGTAATRTRGEVSGGGAKPYRQKGTGRARHGSNREPSMVGGGTVFGPRPRDYSQRMPRKMRRLALRSALSVKAGAGCVTVVDGFPLEEPRTRVMAGLLRGLGLEGTALLVLPAPNDVVARSVSNLPWAKMILAHNLNLHDILTYDQLVIAKDALVLIEEHLSP
jgi:large subunit ribosomal protein L4